jgi:hypothetical protein
MVVGIKTNGGHMSDEESLRRLAREAIAAERIPAERPKGMWGGDGTGVLCDVCGLPIPHGEIEFELEFSQEAGRARNCCHLHSRCFAAWEFECHALEVGEHCKGSKGPAPVPGFHRGAHSHPATDRKGLSAEDKAGSIPGHERNFRGECGSG